MLLTFVWSTRRIVLVWEGEELTVGQTRRVLYYIRINPGESRIAGLIRLLAIVAAVYQN